MEAGADDIPLRDNLRLGFRPSYSVQTNTLSSKIALTSAGFGISLVPRFMEKYIPDDVAILGCTYPSIRMFLFAYVSTKQQSSALYDFIELVKEVYPG